MRPNILSIAGFDPSAGAGLLADAKAAEANGAYCFGVVTAITYQNQSEFDGVEWVALEKIKQQIDVLLRQHSCSVIKIGLIESLYILQQLVEYVKIKQPHAIILWDPILKASAGFEFHTCVQQVQLNKVLKHIQLVTPNIPEAIQLFETADSKQLQSYISLFANLNILLKGGHAQGSKATDILIEKNNITEIASERLTNSDKHGTGCVLSSTIAAYLAQNYDLATACNKAKLYMQTYMASNRGLLGYHYKNEQSNSN